MLRMLKTICNFWSLSSWSLGRLATLRMNVVPVFWHLILVLYHIPYVLNIVTNPDDHTVRTTMCTLYCLKIEQMQSGDDMQLITSAVCCHCLKTAQKKLVFGVTPTFNSKTGEKCSQYSRISFLLMGNFHSLA